MFEGIPKRLKVFSLSALAAIFVFALPIGSWAQGSAKQLGFIDPKADVAFCGQSGEFCFDSGWIAADNVGEHTIAINHSLGVIPRWVSLYFSATGDSSRASPMIWGWGQYNYAGNPVSIEASDAQILLQISQGGPLHGIYDASARNWVTYTKGFFRVFLRK